MGSDDGALADRLCSAISRVLGDALGGLDSDLFYCKAESHYIRWGEVERRMHLAIREEVRRGPR